MANEELMNRLRRLEGAPGPQTDGRAWADASDLIERQDTAIRAAVAAMEPFAAGHAPNPRQWAAFRLTLSSLRALAGEK